MINTVYHLCEIWKTGRDACGWWGGQPHPGSTLAVYQRGERGGGKGQEGEQEIQTTTCKVGKE